MKYTKAYMKKNRILILCKSQEEWDEITKKFKLDWAGNGFGKENCIDATDCSYCDEKYAKEKGYKVITFKQFKKGEKTMKDLTKLEEQYEKLGEEIEALKKEPNDNLDVYIHEDKAKTDETKYWFIDDYSDIDYDNFSGCGSEQDKVDNFNAFKTQKGAERRILVNRYFMVLARCEGARDYRSLSNNMEYSVNMRENTLEVDCWRHSQSPMNFYFEKSEDAKKALRAVEKEFTKKEIKTIFHVK